MVVMKGWIVQGLLRRMLCVEKVLKKEGLCMEMGKWE